MGDVVGRAGRDTLGSATASPASGDEDRSGDRQRGKCVSHGFGLGPDMATALFAAGADVITLGNHAWDRKEIIPYIAQTPPRLDPAR